MFCGLIRMQKHALSQVCRCALDAVRASALYRKTFGSLGMAVQLAEKLLFDRAKLLKTSISDLNYSRFAQPFPKSQTFSYLLRCEDLRLRCPWAV